MVRRCTPEDEVIYKRDWLCKNKEDIKKNKTWEQTQADKIQLFFTNEKEINENGTTETEPKYIWLKM